MLNFIKVMGEPVKRVFFLSVDLALVPLSFWAALVLQSNTRPIAELFDASTFLAFLLVLAAAFANLLRLPHTKLNAYDLSGVGRTALFVSALSVSAYVLGNLSGLAYGFGLYVVFGLIMFLGSAIARLVMLKATHALYRRDETRSRVLIYGAGNTGLQLAQALRSHDTIIPVAFADDNSVLQGRYIVGLPVLKPGRIEEFASRHGVSRVLLAMPSLSQPKRTRIARRLEAYGLEVQALPSFSQLIGEEALVDKFEPVLPGQLLGRATVDEALASDCSHFRGRNILVTGAGGSIGGEICRQMLACAPAKLVLFELSELALYTIDLELRELAASARTEIVTVLGSVSDGQTIRRVLHDNQIDVVLHAAAYKHVPLVETNALSGLNNNVLGTSVLARAALEAEVERFILISSDKAVRPTSIMGASKRLAELVVQDLADRSEKAIFAMVRFGNVIGSSGSVIPLFQEQIARGGPVTLTHPDVTRYFMTVQEAVQLVVRASTLAEGGEVFVLDMGDPVPIYKILHQMIHAAGYSIRDAENPEGDIEILVTGLRPGEKLEEELLIGAGHLTTSHEKIFAAREARLSEIEVASALRALREAVEAADQQAALAVLERWVEGWSGLSDKKIEGQSSIPI